MDHHHPIPHSHAGGSSSDSSPRRFERAGEGNGEQGDGRRKSSDGGKVKRIPSCDICRMRKVKCVKLEAQTRCQGCTELDRNCTYEYKPKKPGPPNPYTRSAMESYHPYPPSSKKKSSQPPHPTTTTSSSSIPHHSPPHHHAQQDSLTDALSYLGSLPPTQAYPEMPFQLHQPPGPSPTAQGQGQGQGQYPSPDLGMSFELDDDLFRPWVCSSTGGGAGTGGMGPPTGGSMSTNGGGMSFPLDWEIPHLPQYPASNGSQQQARSQSAGSPPFKQPDYKPQPQQVQQGGNAVASGSGKVRVGSGDAGGGGAGVDIEQVARWSTILSFLSLYFEHLYPLLPLMHWPSFSQQLIARLDRRDPTFRSFLLSLVAYSILQLPRSVIPPEFTQAELGVLHARCHAASRRLQGRVYEPVRLVHISTLYCDHIYLGSTGKDNAANAVLAEAMRLAISMGLHDDSVAAGQGLDAIERETRRRVFWVLYGSDRTIAALVSCPLLLSDEDISVSDPLEVDDSLITIAGSFQQPPNRTPIISGFVHVTRIFRLLSHVLRLVRRRARLQPAPFGGGDGDSSPDGYPDPRHLIRSLQALLDDLPPPLRLQTDVQEHRNPSENNAFETCKANLLVSQVLVRFAIYQYAMLRPAGGGGGGGAGGAGAGAQGRGAEQYLDELTEDVLKTLHNMSSESLAANGESIRRKVLFIASSLLNKYPGDNAGSDHVADFLNVYNKILREQTTCGLDSGGEDQEMNIPPGTAQSFAM